MRKFLILTVLFCVVLSLCVAMSVTVNAEASGTCGADGDNLTWVLDDNGVLTITGTGEMKKWSNYSATPWYYNYRTQVKSIVIEEGVTSITRDSFYQFTKLESVTLPDSLTSIGVNAFEECTSLKNIEIPSGIDTIPNYMLKNCTGITSINIPSNIKTIKGNAFYGCSGLTELVIPDTLEVISGSAFYQCTGLKKLTIGTGVTEIGLNAFYYCTALEEIYWNAKNVEDFSSRDEVFRSAGSNGGGIKLVFGNTAEKIPAYAFTSAQPANITEITFGSNLKSIGDYAFQFTPVKTLALPAVETVGAYAFNKCLSLETITFGDKIKTIGANAFNECSALKSVNLPDSLEKIGNYAFYGCSALDNIVIPAIITDFGRYTFSRSGITKASFKEGTKTTGPFIFENCAKLETVYLPDSIEHLEENTFAGCTALASVTLPKNLKTMDSYVLYQCPITEIVLPDGLTNVPMCTFKSCLELDSIVIPDSVTSVGDSAFIDCKGLKSVTIGKNVETIGTNVFKNCEALEEVYWNTGKVSSLNNSSTFYNAGQGGTGINFVFGDGVEIIPDTIFYTSSSSNMPNLKSVTIPNSVKKFGTAAFRNCTTITDIYYYGTEDNWNSIDFGSYNTEYLTNATIHYIKAGTATTLSGNVFTIVPTGIPAGSNIMLVCYKENAVTFVKQSVYSGSGNISVTVDKEYDDVKVFVWETEAMSPVVNEPEDVILTTNN